jgi:hypothetical protein
MQALNAPKTVDAYQDNRPHETVTIRGRQFKAPAHIKEILIENYGPNWTIPDHGHCAHGWPHPCENALLEYNVSASALLAYNVSSVSGENDRVIDRRLASASRSERSDRSSEVDSEPTRAHSGRHSSVSDVKERRRDSRARVLSREPSTLAEIELHADGRHADGTRLMRRQWQHERTADRSSSVYIRCRPRGCQREEHWYNATGKYNASAVHDVSFAPKWALRNLERI